MHPDVEKALNLAPLGHALCAYVAYDNSHSLPRIARVMLASYGPAISVCGCPYLEAKALVVEINDLIALHNKMKGR